MNKKKYLIIILLFLFGCKNPTYAIKLTQDTYEYEDSTFDVCQFIESIDDIKIREFNREKNKILEGNYSVQCPSLTIKELGKQEVIISVNNINIPVNFIVTDTTPPKIDIEKTEYTVEEGNEYFNIEKLVTVTDNYDKNPVVGFSGYYNLQECGEYTVTIKATDKNGNENSKDIKIIVTEKQVEIIEKEVVIYGGNSSNNNSSNPGNGGANIPQKNPTVTLPLKNFLFEDGYDMNSGFSACQVYRDSAGASGRCSPLKNENGITYGYQYTP